MRALVWDGINKLTVENVDEPSILNSHDIIVKVTTTAVCGSDLHLLGGYVPFMRAGDVIGHEFMGEVVEVGPSVVKHKIGDRVVVCTFIACGSCWYCQEGKWSLCDNTNPSPGLGDGLFGASTAGCFGFGRMYGPYAGGHAEYVRVPFAEHGAFTVPEGLSDSQAVFAADAVPTGWQGAEDGGVKPGDVVAVWGAGGVGQMAARSAMLLGAERVIVIDRIPERLAQVEQFIGAETLDFSDGDTQARLRELTGGRGPDVAIEAVGMEAHGPGPVYVYDKLKQAVRAQTDRATAVREAIFATRKGGSVYVLGVFGGLVDKFPLGAVTNKGLRLQGGQQNGQKYIPMLLERIAAGEISTSHLITHDLPLEDGAYGYDIFKNKKDGCVRAVFHP